MCGGHMVAGTQPNRALDPLQDNNSLLLGLVVQDAFILAQAKTT